jgi:hypothetical protein
LVCLKGENKGCPFRGNDINEGDQSRPEG